MSPRQISERIDASSTKNNNLLIFFYIFGLYIFISALSTTDLMLLLPTHTFKMPFISFDLDLIYFYVLAPILLFVLHFNILLNYMVHLKKLYAYKGQVDLESIDPSLYSYAFALLEGGYKGTIINWFLWLLVYFLPMLVFVVIYQRFAAYHHQWITLLHLIIILFDVFLISSSMIHNRSYLGHSQNSVRYSSHLFIIMILFVGFVEVAFYMLFFHPMIDKEYDSTVTKPYQMTASALEREKVGTFSRIICKINHPKSLLHGEDATMDCFPRLVVTEEEMAKISPDRLYIPRHLAFTESAKDKELILKYGARIDLKERNLRYADLKASILTRADMESSELQGIDLSQSHLQAVKLNNARLEDANLMSAQLQEVELFRADLRGANLVSANMAGADLQESILSDAKLTGTRLEDSNLEKATLINADLGYADLLRAFFRDADLTGASLYKTGLTSSVFEGAVLVAADLSGVSFVEGEMKTPDFDNTAMSGANVYGSKMLTHGLSVCQKRLLVNIDTSSHKYLTFYGRRVKYLDESIRLIRSKEPVPECQDIDTAELKKELETRLETMLKTSCVQLEQEEGIYEGNEITKESFLELERSCSSIL